MATQKSQTIVNLVAKLVASPTPSTLQQSGAVISVGGSTLAAGQYQFVGGLTEALTFVGTGGNFTELTNMLTTFFAQGSAVGCYILELGSGITTPNAGIASLNTWINANPGILYAYLTPADWDTMPAPAAPTLTSVSGGTLEAETYYVSVSYTNAAGAVGNTSPQANISVDADYLPEVASPAALSGATGYNVYMGTSASSLTLQNTSPITIGTPYTLPDTGVTTTGGAAPLTLAQLCNDWSAPTGKTYFFGTTSTVNAVAYGTVSSNGTFQGYKAAILTVPSPSAQSTEFQAAALFYQMIVNNPGPANKLAPVQYRYVYGVTPWPSTGYTAEINTALNYNCNIIGTGAEGGINNSCIFGGTTSSNIQISWWYGIDWEQIQIQQAVSAAVINGSNTNPPLLYDQEGINTLEAVAQQIADNGVTFGCALSAVVSSIPFYTYAQENPDDYAAGIYSGLSAQVVGQNGFILINFYLSAIEFVASA